METEIRAGLPIPPRGSSMVRYPFADMKVGDSFDRPKEQQDKLRVAGAHHKKRSPGWNYETRIVGDVIRLWCIAVPKTERKAQ